ncbi:MAG: cupin domain-containing protein [Gemmatimonadota bacterium]|nr:cupin domain-containing protein [Gemmatimonadota bacterium]
MSEAYLGPSVRRLREAQQLSLRTLAARTGFSASFLSQVENSQASPSIASMERIATALGVTLGEFFKTAESRPLPVVRVDARPVLHSGWSKAKLEALGAGGVGGCLEPVLVTLQSSGSSGSRAYASGREEFALVLEGTVVLTLDDSEQVLACGDAVTIRAGALRRWRNPGDQPVRILMVAAR